MPYASRAAGPTSFAVADPLFPSIITALLIMRWCLLPCPPGYDRLGYNTYGYDR